MILRAGPDDAARIRDVRLRALADAPDAFWTTLAEAMTDPVEEWQSRLAQTDRVTLVAVHDGRDVGIVFGGPHHDADGDAGLYGMWVDPAARRLGLARLLIEAVRDWAAAAGFGSLRLEVADSNAAAIATYTSLGFVPTGRRGAMPSPRDHITEHELALTLD